MTSPTLNNWDTTLSADPWSDAGYAQWYDAALATRRQWMEMMGLDKVEIDAQCAPGMPANLDDELAEYNAMLRIQQINIGRNMSR